MRKLNRTLFVASQSFALPLAASLVLSLAACEGPPGAAGPQGTAGANGKDGTNGNNGNNGNDGNKGDPGGNGPKGDPGDPGPAGCDGLNAGDSARLAVTLGVAAPKNGKYFDVGEQATFTINLVDRCNRPVDPAKLATLNVYLAGPRAPLATKTATKLLNCVTDRQAVDRQHHTVSLLSPKFADGAQKNLTATSTGWIFTTAPVSDEAAGTYTAALWAVTKDQIDQQFLTANIQIRTETVEAYTSGEPKDSKCLACHLGPANGKVYMAHILPGFAPLGNYAIDQTPIENCKVCHNSDGYSANTAIAKIHAVHHGDSLLNPGAAHPEYGLPADPTIAEFVNVGFPDFPNAERDCAACHVNDANLKKPSRLACGTCHDNLFFDTGVLNPPRAFGKPYKGALYASGAAFSCASDSDCNGFGSFATCDVLSGACFRKSHPKLNDDTQCAICHTADNSGLSPIAERHNVPSRDATKLDGLTISDVTITGATGGGGKFFQLGDVPVVTFKVSNKAGVVKALTDKLDPNYANWAGNVIISGPNENPQRVWAMTNLKTAVLANAAPALTFDGNTGLYTFTFPVPTGELSAGWPAKAQLPLNSQPSVLPSDRQVNVAGSYTFWLYVTETLRPAPPNIRNTSWRDVDNFITSVRFGSDGAAQPRQVITATACNSCHTVTQAHGGSRQEPHVCFTCHTAGAEDSGVLGTKGAKCTTANQATDCTGFNNGTQACQDTNNDGTADTCVLVKDPTPNQSVSMDQFIHQVHFGRKLEGWNQRNNVAGPGQLIISGANFSEVLFPVDVRNCGKCHGDQGGQCSAMAPCAIGQSCVAGTCQNTSYLVPKTRVCLTCHDSGSAFAHAAINTYNDQQAGPIESCDVCHGEGAQFDVRTVHNISNPYVPPYSREP